MEKIKKLTVLSRNFCRYISYCSMAALVFIMALMTVDVLLRHLFNKPIFGSFDLVTLTMTILVFSSWSYTQSVYGHVHVTMLVSMMPRVLRFICFGFTSTLSTGLMGFATYAAYLQIFRTIADSAASGTLLIPIWPFMALMCASLAAFTFTLFLDAVKAIGAVFSEELARDVQSSWT